MELVNTLKQNKHIVKSTFRKLKMKKKMSAYVTEFVYTIKIVNLIATYVCAYKKKSNFLFCQNGRAKL